MGLAIISLSLLWLSVSYPKILYYACKHPIITALFLPNLLPIILKISQHNRLKPININIISGLVRFTIV